jgi:hypothetical protein
MKDILDILYDLQNQSVASDKINTDSETRILLQKKDNLESRFASEILLKGQDIPFDDFMDALDNCNDDLKRITFKKGFAIGLTIMKDALKYSQTEQDNPIIKLIEGMQ